MPSAPDQLATSLVQQLARGAFEGIGPLAPAHEVARQARVDTAEIEDAIDRVVADHTRLAGINGFVTGLGGFIVLPIAIPANVVGFYTVAARMVAAIADLRGHDLTSTDTRVAVLAALTGDDLGKLLGNAGIVLPPTGVTSAWLRRMAPSTTTMVNKAIGMRLLVGTGERALVKLGRAIPMAGGLIGGTVDVAMIRSIARHARQVFAEAEARIAATEAPQLTDPVA